MIYIVPGYDVGDVGDGGGDLGLCRASVGQKKKKCSTMDMRKVANLHQSDI